MDDYDGVGRGSRFRAIQADRVTPPANQRSDIHVDGYRNVRIVLTTNVTHAVTDADLELAAKIDAAEQTPWLTGRSAAAIRSAS